MSARRLVASLVALSALFGVSIVAWIFAVPTGSLPSFRPNPPTKSSEAEVRLCVLVVFDQMRGDYLTRWEELFDAQGGFRRMFAEGAWFQNCHFPYANTKTGAGHASVATGTSPSTHGIVANDWFDVAIDKEVYCVGTDRYDRVPTTGGKVIQPTEKKKAGRTKGASPERLLSPTFADALKQSKGGSAKVVALSLKDRSAVLPAGTKPDACYWFDASTGGFVTSTYYRDGLHSWVDAFNKAKSIDRFWNKDWTRLRPDLDYEKFSGIDDQPGENTGVRQGRIFPHPMNAGLEQFGAKYYDVLAMSPFGNQALLDLAKSAIDAEKLGQDDTPDFLSVSFSSNDLIGHSWGPDSHEVLDVTLRSDLIVKELLDHLDAKVGKGRYVLAITSDHGVCPLPEVEKAKGNPASRIDMKSFLAGANAHLHATFAKEGVASVEDEWIAAEAEPWFYLDRTVMKKHGSDAARVETALAEWFAKQDGIQAAFTRAQIVGQKLPDDPISRRVAKSFHPDRAGDVFALLQPYHLFSSVFGAGTTHGTPHAYDTHAPLLVMGPGVKPGAVHQDEVPPQAIVPIFSKAVGITPPRDCDAKVPRGTFAD